MGEDELTLPEAMRQAKAEYERGNFERARAICCHIVEAKGESFDVVHLLAVTQAGLKRFDEALESYDQALRLHPDHAEVLYNRGITLRALNRFAEAVDSYDRALRQRPDYVEALNNRGNALKGLQRLQEALDSYDRALKLRPDHIEAQYNRGNTLQALNRHSEAVESYDHVLGLRPDHVEALHNRGNALQALWRLEDAVDSYDRALKLHPKHAEALVNRGNALKELNRLDEALKCFDRALDIRPDYVEALNNRGTTFNALGRMAEALHSIDRAIELRPDYVEALSNRGVVLQELGRVDEAMDSFNQSVELRLNQKIDDSDVRWNRGLLHLLRGEAREGWNDYEFRRKRKVWTVREFSGSEWQGDLRPGMRLLLYAEQGLGDTIQFARFASMLAAHGLSIGLEVQKPLKGLLDDLLNVTVFRRGESLPPYETHCPLMSVPFKLGMGFEDVGIRSPYLFARRNLVDRWRSKLSFKGLRIGIAWQGSTAKIDAGRSLPLSVFGSISRLPGVRLISLQKGVEEAQIRSLAKGMNVEMLGSEFDAGPDAFLDSAAVMKCCDLVITSDTAIAHLAGALAVPVWVALKYVPDWRWMLKRSDSPWYPSMRLFRQPQRGDWDSVMATMAAELDKLSK